EIEECTLEFPVIKPAFNVAYFVNTHREIVKSRVGLDRIQRALHGGLQAAVSWRQGPASTRDLEQGVKQLCQSSHSHSHLLIAFLALFGPELVITTNLG